MEDSPRTITVDLASTARVPALHEPTTRIHLGTVGAWEIRAMPINRPLQELEASRGMLHLQCWHPGRRMSLITKSTATDDRFELWTPTRHTRLCCYRCVVRFLVEKLDVLPPPVRAVRNFEMWFVFGAMVGRSHRSLEAGSDDWTW